MNQGIVVRGAIYIGKEELLYARLTLIQWMSGSLCVILIGIVNSLTPRVKPWVIQSYLTFDSIDRTLKCDQLLESC